MQTYGAYEAKTHFSVLLEQVEKGEQVLITKHGHPIARLIPSKTPDQENIRLAIKRLQEFNKTNRLDGLDWRALRDEGRK